MTQERKGRPIDFIEGGVELLEQVAPLWEALNEHHAERSVHFQDRFNSFSFAMRKKAFETPGKELLIILVNDPEDQKVVGYSIASIQDGKNGEIESLYIEPEYRGLNIGEELMKRPLEWFEKEDVPRVILGVAIGNENVYPFYEKFGFYPRTTILEKK